MAYQDGEAAANIIIDNGSGMIKAGFAGEALPRVKFPSIVGWPKHRKVIINNQNKECYFGDEADEHRGVLTLRYPVEHGIVTNWDEMTRVWDYTFKQELRVNPADHPVMLTDSPLNPKSCRQKTAEVMFETFNVPALYIATQAVLSLYSSNMMSGLVIDSGDGVTHTVPVYEGYAIPHCISRIDIAGRDLTFYLCRLLRERGFSFVSTAEHQIVRSIKEKLCYVSQSFDEEVQAYAAQPIDAPYQLPDGQLLHLGTERFRCPEALFRPHLLGIESPGIGEMAHSSVMRCDIDLRRTLLSGVLLTGGTMMFPGMERRLEDDLITMMDKRDVQVEVRAPPERQHAVWIGGSILSSLGTFQNLWVTRQLYDEYGPGVVHRKCI
ncbi:hypothetical protein CAPTEDRAFT_185824 [Capitella teleta]|uniref:Actin, cytoplasmic n=1 Tax=Capitella teleta TaxID=283909 RepID=R7URM9_CAPTE|nr:hypothetical protein CAPTEDRAFT_185824 [Capitella teleta]|eukprot:ELU06547.1 hypothetical protein CAPTEDRAFT_185824 [Capitella teleta]